MDLQFYFEDGENIGMETEPKRNKGFFNSHILTKLALAQLVRERALTAERSIEATDYGSHLYDSERLLQVQDKTKGY
jgi:hypothetical protein